MAERLRLTDGVDTIDLSPRPGWNIPQNRAREITEQKGGLIEIYEYGNKQMYEVPLNNISESDADQLISWWENLLSINFTPDLQGDPGTTVTVKIADMDRPMQMWGGDYDDKFAGVLTLYQTSSVSFSADPISVSASRSCSVSVSRSCAPSESTSCSTYLSESTSVSQSTSCSTSGSTSCSVSNSVSCSISQYLSCSTSGSLSTCSISGSISCSTSGSTSCSTSYSVSCSASGSGEGFLIEAQSCSGSLGSSCGDIDVSSCSLSAGGYE